MAYDRVATIRKINEYKNLFENTANDNSLDEQAKQSKLDKYRLDASTLYGEMAANNDRDIADQLQKSDYGTAQGILDKYGIMGKEQTRPYLNSKLKDYGVQPQYAFDNRSNEVSANGAKIGVADYIDTAGNSYYNKETLDNFSNSLVKNNNLSLPNEKVLSAENQSLIKKYSDEYDYLTKTDPLSTPTSKSILERYDLSAIQAKDNAAADGGAGNGGNIDSYSANVALTNQTKMRNLGEQEALTAHQQRVNNVQKILSDLGVNLDRTFNQDQTAKSNDVARDTATSQVTGTVPTSMSIRDNIYFNADGTLKDETTDFQAIINNADEIIKSSQDPTEIKNAQYTKQQAMQARAKKVQNPVYAKYLSTVGLVAPSPTATVAMAEKQLASNEKVASLEQALKLKLAEIEKDTKLSVADKEVLIAQAKNDNAIALQGLKNDGDLAVASVKINDNTKMNTAINKSVLEKVNSATNPSKFKFQPDVLITNADGSLRFNPAIKDSQHTYYDKVVETVLSDKSIPIDIRTSLLLGLGIPKETITLGIQKMPDTP